METFNEWKESDNYLYSKWFDNTKSIIHTIFDELQDLTLDYFEYDATGVNDVYVGIAFFTDEELQYKLAIYLDPELFNEGTIESIKVQLKAYTIENNTLLGILDKEDIQKDDLTSDFIIQLIDDYKTQFIEDKIDICDL
jgi:hypothetical protein